MHNNLQMCESERRHYLGGTRDAHEMLMKDPFEMHCGYSVAAFFGSWTNPREVLSSSSAAVGV